MRKSLLSALIGIAVADHRINLNANLAQLGTDDPAPGCYCQPRDRRRTAVVALRLPSATYSS